MAIEDRRFYGHWGIDPYGLARAAWRTLLGGAREGGSTITQQYVRLTSLSQEKTLRRKAQETLLALRVEASLDEDEILLVDLDAAYFGAGAYGADAAARRHSGKPACADPARGCDAGRPRARPLGARADEEPGGGRVRHRPGGAGARQIVGGKTGASQDFCDAWFVGMTPDLVVGPRIGSDDDGPMNRMSGGAMPPGVFHDFVRRASAGSPRAAASTPRRSGPSRRPPRPLRPRGPPRPPTRSATSRR